MDPLFRALFENSPDAILIANDEGVYVDANPVACRWLATSREGIVGKRILDFVKPEDVHPTKLLWGDFREAKTQQGEITLRAGDGSVKILEYSAVASVVPGLHISILRDQTAERAIAREHEEVLKSRTSRALEANRMKSSFIANISHEIRTPLNALLGFNELLKNGDLSPEDRSRFHDIITRNGETLLKLIDDLLDLSRFEGGQLSFEARPVTLKPLLNEVAGALRPAAEAKGLEFSLTTNANLPELIKVDASRLKQVLMNLGGNAVKFTREGIVEISVTAQKDPERIDFDIRDTGVGITHEHRDQLFRPFAQGDSSTARRFGGTGLGLTLAKKIMESMGGDVELVDSKPGLGSLFRVTLKTQLGGVLADVPLKDPVSSMKGVLAGRRILLVEDSVDNQILIRRFLETHGGEVDVVANGKMALDQAFEVPYDIVLMDLQMPVLDGRSATKLLRMKGFTAPIIAITAHAMTTDRESALAAGCTDFLTKPLDFKDFLAAVHKALT